MPQILQLSDVSPKIALLGLRFFWAVGNMKRFIGRQGTDPEARIRRVVTTVHFPVLLLHAFTILCAVSPPSKDAGNYYPQGHMPPAHALARYIFGNV